MNRLAELHAAHRVDGCPVDTADAILAALRLNHMQREALHTLVLDYCTNADRQRVRDVEAAGSRPGVPGRATTLVFVSDTLAVTKVSSQQALVWSVNRLTGLSQPDSQVVITDGVGIVENGKTGSDGVFVAKRSIPERTHAMVEDRAGGVSVSENFFYDSEIFQGKVFVFTDRPLYQPGEKVIVCALGRDLKREGSKDVWSSLPAKNAHVSVLDSTGVVLLNQKLNWDAVTGGEVRFKLPEESESGGYALRLSLDGEVYGAAFRVARFTKPHFDSQNFR